MRKCFTQSSSVSQKTEGAAFCTYMVPLSLCLPTNNSVLRIKTIQFHAKAVTEQKEKTNNV